MNNEIIISLEKSRLSKIVSIQLKRVEKLLEERDYRLEATQAGRDYLAKVGYHPDYGAQQLKRAMQWVLQDPLAINY